MEMNELFYKNTYLREFDAEVISCTPIHTAESPRFEVILDDTAFYPEGGGQPADRGILKMNGENSVQDSTFPADGYSDGLTVHVQDVQRRADDVIVHYTDAPLPEGAAVHGKIDWARRFDLMQNHSGEHIISGLVHAHYGYENVGYHMGDDVITIDLSGPLTWDQLMEIEREANGRVYENLPIEITYPSEEELKNIQYRSKKELTGRVRIVTIPDTDVCACCGTHVARTGEIGLIKCLSMIHYKGGVRITMASGGRALRIMEQRTDVVNDLAKQLAVDPALVPDGFARVKEESFEKSRRIGEIMTMYYGARADALPDGRKLTMEFEDSMTPVEARRFCEFLLEHGKGTCCAVFTKQGEGWYYVIGSRSIDVRPLVKTANAALSGRGGGKPEMAQGTMAAPREEIEAELIRFTSAEE
jgi:alanyl-tRNA synthetase